MSDALKRCELLLLPSVFLKCDKYFLNVKKIESLVSYIFLLHVELLFSNKAISGMKREVNLRFSTSPLKKNIFEAEKHR